MAISSERLDQFKMLKWSAPTPGVSELAMIAVEELLAEVKRLRAAQKSRSMDEELPREPLLLKHVTWGWMERKLAGKFGDDWVDGYGNHLPESYFSAWLPLPEDPTP